MIALWLLRRLLLAAILLLALACAVFVAIHLQSNPLDLLISPDADPDLRASTQAALGVDQPIALQFAMFLRGLLHGTLGRSFVYNEPAIRVALGRMPATLELALPAALLAVVIGLPLGVQAAKRPNSAFGRLVRAASVIGRSLPAFWLGLMLVALFAIQLGVLPGSGRGEVAPLEGVGWSFLTWDGVAHLLLPVTSLAVGNIALVLGIGWRLAQEAEAGFARRVIAPVLMAVAVELGSTIAGAVVTENIFAWPGIGKLLIDSFNVLDRPVILAIVVVVIVVIAALNLFAELLARLLGPSMPSLRPVERPFAHPAAIIATLLLLAVVAVSVDAAQIAIQDPYDAASFNSVDANLAPLSPAPEGQTYWLGTDGQGRDLLSGIIYGVRLSLLISAGAVVVAILFGATLGAAAALAGGAVEALISWVGAVQLALPPFLVSLLLLAFTTRRISHVVLALVLVQWPRHALIAHIGVTAPAGSRRWRLMMPLFAVEGVAQMAAAILLEATLSFLGLGLPITTPSLGVLIANGTDEMLEGHFGPMMWPGIALFLLILVINTLAYRLRRHVWHPALG